MPSASATKCCDIALLGLAYANHWAEIKPEQAIIELRAPFFVMPISNVMLCSILQNPTAAEIVTLELGDGSKRRGQVG